MNLEDLPTSNQLLILTSADALTQCINKQKAVVMRVSSLAKYLFVTFLVFGIFQIYSISVGLSYHRAILAYVSDADLFAPPISNELMKKEIGTVVSRLNR